MKAKLLFSVLTVAALLTSCSSGVNTEILYPFQEEENGRWGLISSEGNIVIEDEFNESPTLSYDGVFFALAKDGVYLYSAKSKPEQIAGPFIDALPFQGNVTPVVKKDKPISFINKNGEIIFTLDKYKNQAIISVGNYSEGAFIFTTEKNLKGAVDETGKIIIQPNYVELGPCKNGVFVATKQAQENIKENQTVLFLNNQGQKIYSFTKDKYSDNDNYFTNGHLRVTISSNNGQEDSKVGLINTKGEWILKATNKIHKIGEYFGDKFTYTDGTAWGIMSINGENIVRPKYESIKVLNDNRFVVEKNRVVNIDGETIIEADEYKEFSVLADAKFIANESSNSWVFVDNEGKVKNKQKSYYKIIASVDENACVESNIIKSGSNDAENSSIEDLRTEMSDSFEDSEDSNDFSSMEELNFEEGENPGTTPTIVIITGDRLRMHTIPSTSEESIVGGVNGNIRLNKGMSSKYLGEEGDFYKILYNGNPVYISKKYAILQ